MKVANIKAGSVTSTNAKQSFDSIFMHPCYYAEIEKGDKRRNWIWKIGCKRENDKSDEMCVKIYKFGDVNDDKTWQRLTGAEFAVLLIDTYRDEGEAGIKRLVKDNSPQVI